MAALPAILAQDRLIRSQELRQRLGNISETTLWRWQHRAQNPFPASIDLGGSVRFWREAEVETWINQFLTTPAERGTT